MHADLLTKVPIFKFCETKCIVILVQCMRTRIFLPTEMIIQQGDVGSSLFFIRMGQVLNQSTPFITHQQGDV